VITVPSEHQNGQPHQELPANMIKIGDLPGRYVLMESGWDNRSMLRAWRGQ